MGNSRGFKCPRVFFKEEHMTGDIDPMKIHRIPSLNILYYKKSKRFFASTYELHTHVRNIKKFCDSRRC
jgi:hypothetical protein